MQNLFKDNAVADLLTGLSRARLVLYRHHDNSGAL